MKAETRVFEGRRLVDANKAAIVDIFMQRVFSCAAPASWTAARSWRCPGTEAPSLFSRFHSRNHGLCAGFQVLAASVAVGLSSTFAATIGGVLFSIEITTLYYDVGNYFKAFVAAISGTVAVSLVRTLVEGSPVSCHRIS